MWSVESQAGPEAGSALHLRAEGQGQEGEQGWPTPPGQSSSASATVRAIVSNIVESNIITDDSPQVQTQPL